MNAMLLHKAWVETRLRFLAGLIACAIVCIYYVNSHAWLVAMWTHDLQDPKSLSRWPWLPLGIHEYGWYLWHYLYDNYLQQVWALFGALFAFGGLIRERTDGTALFSLGLPVTRTRWLVTRLSVAMLEGAALSLFAVVVIIAYSSTIHQSYSYVQVLLHAVLMVASGVVMIALGNLCFTLFPGGYLSLILTLAVAGVPYLYLQAYMQSMRADGRSTWLATVDIAHVMGGPWQLTWTTTPWAGLVVTWLCSAALFGAAAVHGDRVDY